jgi:hypothetical protein
MKFSSIIKNGIEPRANRRIHLLVIIAGSLALAPLILQAQSNLKSELLNPVATLVPDTPSESSFGSCIDISGDHLAVGGGNSVHIYRRTNDEWAESTNLTFDSECTDVAIDGTRLVIGLPWPKTKYARVAIYTNSTDGIKWVEEKTLYSGVTTYYDFYGRSIDIDGDTIVVGAYLANADGSQKGQIYVYDISNNWQKTTFTAPDGQNGDEFGWEVCVSSNLIGVCAYQIIPAYMFLKSGNAWAYSGRSPITATHLAIGGSRVAVISSGQLHLYNYLNAAWIPTLNLDLGQTESFGELYGRPLALEGNLLVAVSRSNFSYPGQIHVFESDGQTWQEQIVLIPPSTTNGNNFGKAVAVSDETLAVGAPVDYSDAGSAHIYGPTCGNPETVARYVRKYLYPKNASTSIFFEEDAAAFRYKDRLFTNDTEGIRLEEGLIDNLYGQAEQDRSWLAEEELLKGLTYHPDSTILWNLLLDIYYERSLPEQIIAANALGEVEAIRLSPPSIPSGLVIDDEIEALLKAQDAYRPLIVNYFSLFTNTLDIADTPPLGYRIFQELAPTRNLTPMHYLDDGELASVNGSTNILYEGYKDLVFLYEALRDYGRTVEPIAQLMARYDAAGAKELVTDAQRFLYLHAGILNGMFADQSMNDPVRKAIAAVNTCLTDLDNLKQTLIGGSNLLGFEDDFLMLIQKFAGQSEDIFDSFDAFELRLDPDDLSSPLNYAMTLREEAIDSYSDYRGYQDQLETQLSYITGSAEDRLFQIAGAYPDEAAYNAPENNDGCEIWMQLTSIETAQLQIQRNKIEIANLEEEVRIEVARSQSVQDTKVSYGNKQVSLTEWIGHINAAQTACDKMASAKSFGDVANAAIQAAGEEVKGQLQAEKERLAAEENAKIEGIESAAKVETLMLGMKTLAIDSQEAAILLKQEMGRLAALYRDKEDLERTLAENDASLAGRYFADPTHHLRYQHQTMLANLSFDEAQKWLYFMARALEYKWNTPFANYFYLGRKWSTGTLFKLRNAGELQEFYNAMVSFNSLVQLPQDDYFDWFSVREDFLGYKDKDDEGYTLYYPDPANLDSSTLLTATDAFRSYLRTKMDAIGNIKLTFSTRREIPGGTFYRGPRYDEDRNVLSAGLFLDKIKWLKINLPGSHSLGRTQLAGELSYGGTGFIRNFDVGTFLPNRPDRLQNEETAYSTRYWHFHAPSAKWRFSEALSSPVTMRLSSDPRVPPTVQEIDIFKERSVATTGWDLTVPTEDLGVPVLDINELDDIELYFYHYAVSRQLPESSDAVMSTMAEGEEGAEAAPREIPFPYNLRYESNEE